jgi:hypothetical protein
MAGTLKLTDIAHSSGAGTITVDSLATLAISTGKLTVGGTAIETGAHTTAVSALNPLTITSGNVTGKSNYVVSYNASSGTSTAMVVNLPTPASFQTTVISVVSSTTHGAGNSIVIKDSDDNEVYTLYHKGDHCEFVSDGTNTLRAGNEHATIRGSVALTADVTIAGNTYVDIFNGADAANYSVEEDIGGGWSTANDDWTVPYTGRYWFGGHFAAGGYISGFFIYKDGTALTTGKGTEILYGGATQSNLYISLTAGEVITWWAGGTDAATVYVAGDAAKNETQAMWWMVRRD